MACCQSLTLLEQLFDKVYITKWVYDEICQIGKPFYVELSAYFSDKIYDDFTLNDKDNLLSRLDIGETSSILLYQYLNADYLLIDERKGRAICSQLDIHIIGSLGILLLSKQQGLIQNIKPLILKLKHSPVFFDELLLKKVLIMADEY